MAYDKEKGAARLAEEFGRIGLDGESRAATEVVAAAVAGEIARALGEAEVETRVAFKAEVAAVPTEVAVDETMKGRIR